MTDNKKLVKFLDEHIDSEDANIRGLEMREIAEPHDYEARDLYKEIKGIVIAYDAIVEEYLAVREAKEADKTAEHQPQPDELVEKIYKIMLHCNRSGDYMYVMKTKAEIRTLISKYTQSRQPICIFCAMLIKDDEGACKSCANQAMEDLSKSRPDRTDSKFSYDKFIKNHACILHPDRASEGAHFPITDRMGDKLKIPLCHECHMELHNGDVTWYGKYKRKLGVYLEELVGLLEKK